MSVSYIEKDNRRHMYREANFIKNPLKALQCYFNYCHFVTFLPFVQKAASVSVSKFNEISSGQK
ncbi:hemerythrin-related protein [Trichinella spiralis]|uniref:Uncharacterized protein n=1 Tax=Trichinella spiralis TaxID=6334 RepID=E5T3X3_TRISP|nr:hemerythrin-related protein [Trichinella spiralis]KRY32751.1 hypothetical protein T01_1256 [Trichinella spiralis]